MAAFTASMSSSINRRRSKTRRPTSPGRAAKAAGIGSLTTSSSAKLHPADGDGWLDILLVNGIYTDIGWEPFTDYYAQGTPTQGITYVGKAEYMDSWKTKYLFPALCMIPIDRSGGNASQAALDAYYPDDGETMAPAPGRRDRGACRVGTRASRRPWPDGRGCGS